MFDHYFQEQIQNTGLTCLYYFFHYLYLLQSNISNLGMG